MSKKNKVLCLFTIQFPYEIGEPHLESEMEIINRIFDKVYIFPAFRKGEITRHLPEKFEIKALDNDWNKHTSRLFSNNIVFIMKTFFSEFLFSDNKSAFLNNIRRFKNILLHRLYIAEQLEKFVVENQLRDAVYYTYWFSESATSLGILKGKNVINSFISRAHRFDVYEEGGRDKIIPFRHFQLKMVDKVLTDSQKAAEYLIHKKKEFASKISCSYYGVPDHGTNPFDENEIFTIVSCSMVHYRKRMHLIVEILKHIDFPIRWIHFGDGELMSDIKEKANTLPANVKVEFKGLISNKEVFDYYRTHSINLMLLVSESEGLPMTLIEACSFGIPLMVADVGGVSEITTKETGVLLNKDFDPLDVANKIKTFKSGSMNTKEFRVGVKKFWFDNFNEKTNYQKFYNQIDNIRN